MKMERKKTFLAIALCALLSVYLIAPTNATATEAVTVTGRVYAADFDDDDNCIALGLRAENRELYKVFNDDKGKELFKHINKHVKVTGTIIQDRKGKKTIKVAAYEVVKKRKK
jgi:hypothetical protein